MNASAQNPPPRVDQDGGALADPMERIIAVALNKAGIVYTTDQGDGNKSNLDFHLTGSDVHIEVKRFHTPRVAAQMARVENVIVAQGRGAVEQLARFIEATTLRVQSARPVDEGQVEALAFELFALDYHPDDKEIVVRRRWHDPAYERETGLASIKANRLLPWIAALQFPTAAPSRAAGSTCFCTLTGKTEDVAKNGRCEVCREGAVGAPAPAPKPDVGSRICGACKKPWVDGLTCEHYDSPFETCFAVTVREPPPPRDPRDAEVERLTRELERERNQRIVAESVEDNTADKWSDEKDRADKLEATLARVTEERDRWQAAYTRAADLANARLAEAQLAQRPAPDAAGVERLPCVLPDWSLSLPLQQQSVLMLATRGPDGIAKHHACKNVVRAYRATVLRAARYGRFLDFGEKADTFMGLDRFANEEIWNNDVDAFFDHVDELPHHYLLHLLHGAQIVGVQHPDERFSTRWGQFYARGCDDMHLLPERSEVMCDRLGDWGRRHWSAALATSAPDASTGQEAGR